MPPGPSMSALKSFGVTSSPHYVELAISPYNIRSPELFPFALNCQNLLFFKATSSFLEI